MIGILNINNIVEKNKVDINEIFKFQLDKYKYTNRETHIILWRSIIKVLRFLFLEHSFNSTQSHEFTTIKTKEPRRTY